MSPCARLILRNYPIAFARLSVIRLGSLSLYLCPMAWERLSNDLNLSKLNNPARAVSAELDPSSKLQDKLAMM